LVRAPGSVEKRYFGKDSTFMMRVLILGGTGDAAELAARLATIPGVEVITSLAGRTR
jgi:precorrin-6A/cobalt-precorrin-6A reductase